MTGVRIAGPDPEGTPRTFDCAYHPVLADGSATGLWLTVTEVTGELRARELADSAAADLASERGILREVIASAPAPMAVMWGEELVFSYVNAQALEMLGDEDMIGRTAAEVFPAGAELAAELRDSVLVRGETAHVREVPVGDRYWTFACAPIPGPGQRLRRRAGRRPGHHGGDDTQPPARGRAGGRAPHLDPAPGEPHARAAARDPRDRHRLRLPAGRRRARDRGRLLRRVRDQRRLLDGRARGCVREGRGGGRAHRPRPLHPPGDRDPRGRGAGDPPRPAEHRDPQPARRHALPLGRVPLPRPRSRRGRRGDRARVRRRPPAALPRAPVRGRGRARGRPRAGARRVGRARAGGAARAPGPRATGWCSTPTACSTPTRTRSSPRATSRRSCPTWASAMPRPPSRASSARSWGAASRATTWPCW